jgi:hypothetical protein
MGTTIVVIVVGNTSSITTVMITTVMITTVMITTVMITTVVGFDPRRTGGCAAGRVHSVSAPR